MTPELLTNHKTNIRKATKKAANYRLKVDYKTAAKHKAIKQLPACSKILPDRERRISRGQLKPRTLPALPSKEV